MGLGPRFTKGACSVPAPTYVTGNPKPTNFEILEVKVFKGHVYSNVVAKIKYPDAKNYEGVKILIFRNCNFEKLSLMKTIDPHFCEHEYSPFARFAPTADGWAAACDLAERI